MDDNKLFQWAILGCVILMTIRLEMLNSDVKKLKNG
jgi:hypothetical protein